MQIPPESPCIYCSTASQKNHTMLSYFSYNKLLSHNSLFAMKGPINWHTEENRVPNVDLKPPLLSEWNWFKRDPLARASVSWVWGRRNILITLWTMNLQHSQSTRTQSSFGIEWGISCSQNATETFKTQKECPQGGAHLFHIDTAHALNWPGLHHLGLCSHVNFENFIAKGQSPIISWFMHR